MRLEWQLTSKLEWLDFGKNQLSSLPVSIEQLQQLKELYLRRNPLSDATKEDLRKQLPNVLTRF
ncbi:MAG: leucine-rich repeat domain-containing protein [Saprospiraceae bacterium]|nr:leucine-rich repeat domain-containing protein [Saprospiraceae bacterium]